MAASPACVSARSSNAQAVSGLSEIWQAVSSDIGGNLRQPVDWNRGKASPTAWPTERHPFTGFEFRAVRGFSDVAGPFQAGDLRETWLQAISTPDESEVRGMDRSRCDVDERFA